MFLALGRCPLTNGIQGKAVFKKSELFQHASSSHDEFQVSFTPLVNSLHKSFLF